MTTWTFRRADVVHPIDGISRLAAELLVNDMPTGTYVYTRQRARDLLARHNSGATVDQEMVRATINSIDQLRYLPEHNHEFPKFVMCTCGRHGVALNASGEPIQRWPGYSRSALARLCRDASAFDIPERYRDTMRFRVSDLPLPWESPLDLIAATIPHGDWANTNWCELE